MSVLYIIWYGVVRGILEFVKVGQLMWGSVRVVQLICFLCAAVGVVFLVLLQLGIIKFETAKMYERHFQIVHEPPEYVEGVSDIIVEEDDNEDLKVKEEKGFLKLKNDFLAYFKKDKNNKKED